MRQFKHDTGPFVAVFDGDRMEWFDTDNNRAFGILVHDIKYFEKQCDYRELKPEEFVGVAKPLKEVKTHEETGFHLKVSKEEAKLLMQLARNTKYRQNSISLPENSSVIYYFSITKQHALYSDDDVYGLYAADLRSSHPVVPLEEAVATLVKLQKPEAPCKTELKVGIYDFVIYHGLKEIGMGDGHDDLCLSFDEFEEVYKKFRELKS